MRMHTEVCVRFNSVTMTLFRVSVGLRQGSSFAFILFFYRNGIVKKSAPGGGVKIGDCTVQRLSKADDLVIGVARICNWGELKFKKSYPTAGTDPENFGGRRMQI